MKNNNTNNGWENYILKEPIDGAVFEEEQLILTQTIAKESCGPTSPEQAGYFGGIVKNKKFYIFNHEPLGASSFGKLKIEPYLNQKIYDAYQRELGENIQNYGNLMYHNHPRITEDILRKLNPEQADFIINLFKKEINCGIHDYLKDRGLKVTLEEVLTEVLSRNLSQDDLNNIKGDYHLIISNTINPKDPYSHLNLHKLTEYESKIPCRQIRQDEINIIQKAKQIEKKIRDDWNKQILGFSNADELENLRKNDIEGLWRARAIVSGVEKVDPSVYKPNH